MFNLFKKSTKADKLYKKHKKLLAEAHALSHSNRRASDKKLAEADEIMTLLDNLTKTKDK